MSVSHISIQTICNIIPRTAMSSWITTCGFRHSQRVAWSWIPQVVTSCSPKHSLENPAPYKIQESKPVLRGVQYPVVLGITLGTLNPTSYPESKWYPVQQSLLKERTARILYQERSSLYSVSLRRTYSNPLSKAWPLQDIHFKPKIWSDSGSSKHNCNTNTLINPNRVCPLWSISKTSYTHLRFILYKPIKTLMLGLHSILSLSN